MPLHKLVPLWNIPGITFYSLQKNDGLDELYKLPAHIKLVTFDDFDQSHGRFMDTAALMKNMDLVISLDTAPAHLAGALGIPVWMYLPKAPEWRWMTERIDSPWYPTMRLFRQTNPGNWDEVVSHMAQALLKLISQREIHPPISCNNKRNDDARLIIQDSCMGAL
jgi:hypothetical protein